MQILRHIHTIRQFEASIDGYIYAVVYCTTLPYSIYNSTTNEPILWDQIILKSCHEISNMNFKAFPHKKHEKKAGNRKVSPAIAH